MRRAPSITATLRSNAAARRRNVVGAAAIESRLERMPVQVQADPPVSRVLVSGPVARRMLQHGDPDQMRLSRVPPCFGSGPLTGRAMTGRAMTGRAMTGRATDQTSL